MNNPALIQLRSLRVMAGKRSGGIPALLHGKAASQSGVVLVISLIMLLLLTLIGVTGMQTTSLEEKMSGNLRDKNLAFQAAESALRAAENSLSIALPIAGTVGFYSYTSTTSLADSVISAGSFWTNGLASNPPTVATSTVTTDMLGNGIAQPVYIIKQLTTCLVLPCSPPPTYKITVRATGASTNTVVILQSIYTPL